MKADARTKRALALGSAQALRVLQDRRKALKRRARAVARAGGRPARTGPEAALSALTEAAGGSASRGTLVAEGDSWFDYPWTDVLGCLEDDHGYDVDSVAHRGDRVEEMAYGEGQLAKLVRTIERLLRNGRVPRAILLSGGGNDIAGNEFAVLLDHAASPKPGLNEAILAAVIDERLRASYATILGAVTAISQQVLGATIPIVTHGYDYPVPDGRGFLGGWAFLPGPWLEPALRQKGYQKMPERLAITGALIDRFNRMLTGLVALPAFGHVRHVDLRGTLSRAPGGYKKWWANELHPTRAGFERVAARFAGVL